MKGCQECPCNELKLLQDEVKALRKLVEKEVERILSKEIVPDRKRILKLEGSLPKIKDSLSQVTAVRTTGSWGIAQKRAEVVYSRLLTLSGNGRTPFFSTGDIRKILGVSNYSQAKAAMLECTRLHLDTRIAERGKKKIGIEKLDNVPESDSSQAWEPIGGRKKLW